MKMFNLIESDPDTIVYSCNEINDKCQSVNVNRLNNAI
jgi:hypothetical protein